MAEGQKIGEGGGTSNRLSIYASFHFSICSKSKGGVGRLKISGIQKLL